MNKTKNKGITLVALVITIIILLILAGITISQLTGSGLFEKAQLAEHESKNSQEKEEGILEDYENKIGQYVNGSRDISLEKIQEIVKKEVEEQIKQLQLTSTGLNLECIAEADNSTSWSEVTIQNGISQYKYLYFVFGDDTRVFNSYIMSTDDFKEKFNSSSNYFTLYFSTPTNAHNVYFYYDNDTTIYRKVSTTDFSCKIYGIK